MNMVEMGEKLSSGQVPEPGGIVSHGIEMAQDKIMK